MPGCRPCQEMDIKREKHRVHMLGTESLHNNTTTYSAGFMAVIYSSKDVCQGSKVKSKKNVWSKMRGKTSTCNLMAASRVLFKKEMV